MFRKASTMLILCLLVVGSCSFAVPFVAAIEQPTLTMDFDKTVFLQNIDTSIAISGTSNQSDATVTLTIFDQFDQFVFETTADAVDNVWSKTQNFGGLDAGIYYVVATEETKTVTKWLTYVDTGNWVSVNYPISTTWKGIQYTIFANRTLKLAKGEDSMFLTFPTFNQFSGLTETTLRNGMVFLYRLQKTDVIDCDIAFILAHNGLKFYMNGTQNIPRTLTIHVEANGPIIERLNSIRCGDLVFDYGDLQKFGIDFSYTNENLEITADTVFYLDPTLKQVGFETGDLSEVDTIVGNPTVSIDESYHGSYAMYGNGSDNYVIASCTATTPLNARLFVMEETLPSSGNYDSFMGGHKAGGYSGLAQLGVYNNGTAYFLRANGDWGVLTTFEIDITAGLWYGVEFAIDSDLNTCDIWWNGTLAYEDLQYDAAACDGVYMGAIYRYGGGSWKTWVDYLEISSDGYIGLGSGDMTPPTFSDLSMNSTLAGQPANMSFSFADAGGLSGYIFSYDDGSGTYTNASFVPLTGLSNSSFVEETLNVTTSTQGYWKVYVNDTSNNWNVTTAYSFITNTEPTIGGFSASESEVEPNQIFTISTIVGDLDGNNTIQNVTIGLNGSIVLLYDNATDTFSKSSDPNSYCFLRTGHSATAINATHLQVSWVISLSDTMPTGQIDVISANTTVYDNQNYSASSGTTDLFILNPASGAPPSGIPTTTNPPATTEPEPEPEDPTETWQENPVDIPQVNPMFILGVIAISVFTAGSVGGYYAVRRDTRTTKKAFKDKTTPKTPRAQPKKKKTKTRK